MQIDCKSSLSEEPEGGPDGSLVNHGRGALCCSEAEKSIGLAPTSMVAVLSVQFALNAASILPPGRLFGEGVERELVYDRCYERVRHGFRMTHVQV